MLIVALLVVAAAHLQGSHCHIHEKAGKAVQHHTAPDFAKDNASLVAVQNETHVAVRFDNPVGAWGKSSDWIGMYAVTQGDLRLFTSPIQFMYARDALPNASKDTWPPVKGEVVFPNRNWRVDVVFFYVTGTAMYPKIGAKSNIVSGGKQTAPLYPRLALRDGVTHVTWTQHASPIMGETGGSLTLSGPGRNEHVKAWLEDTYSADDMCDTVYAPAGREGYFAPGQQLTAAMEELKPRTTYSYVVGRGADFSKNISFTTGPALGERVRVAVFGDMGQMVAPIGGAPVYEHDFGEQTGELGSYPTVQKIKKLMDTGAIDGVVHFGDIAYATGYLAEWANFLDMIEPVASKIPWQGSMGNHEMGWSGSRAFLNTSSDSGGECGVPMRAHFPMSVDTALAANGSQLPLKQRDAWYAFEYGNAHFIMLNSEEEFSPTSRQGAWLRNALTKVDRTKTPWLVVTIHRPVLVTSVYDGDLAMMADFQANLMPTLEDARVDMVLSGHHHTYQRMCRYYRGKCVDGSDGKGVYSFVLGMAGYPLQTRDTLPPASYAEYTDKENYGVGVLDFHNATHAEMSFVAVEGEGNVPDRVWLTRRADLDHSFEQVMVV